MGSFQIDLSHGVIWLMGSFQNSWGHFKPGGHSDLGMNFIHLEIDSIHQEMDYEDQDMIVRNL